MRKILLIFILICFCLPALAYQYQEKIHWFKFSNGIQIDTDHIRIDRDYIYLWMKIDKKELLSKLGNIKAKSYISYNVIDCNDLSMAVVGAQSNDKDGKEIYSYIEKDPNKFEFQLLSPENMFSSLAEVTCEKYKLGQFKDKNNKE